MRWIFGALIAALIAQPVQAHPFKCFSRQMLTENLSENYKEVPSHFGITGDNWTIELWVAKTGNRTFTIVMTNGTRTVSCIIAAGTDWTFIAPPVGDPA